MPHNAKVAGRVRDALAGRDRVREVRMFGGLAFMVDERMVVCVSAGGGDLLVRVAPERDAELLKKVGARRQALKKDKDLHFWLEVSRGA